jgi:hypothetical protein
MIGSIFKITIFIESIANRKEMVELPLQLEKASPHACRFVSVEATGVCIPIGNQEILLAAVYKSPGRTWTDANIIELLSFRHKCILAGDLNAKHPSWNSAVSNPSGHKLLQLFDRSDFEILAPQYPSHYSPMGNGDVLDIVVHKNIRLTYLLKLQRLQNEVFRTTGNLPRYTLVRDMHVAFQIPYVYDYIKKLCRRQAEIVHNHENENLRNIGQGETHTENIKGLNLAVVIYTTVQVSRLLQDV